MSSRSLFGHARFSMSSRLGNCEQGARQTIRMRSHCARSGNDSQAFPPAGGLCRSPRFTSPEMGSKWLCLRLPGLSQISAASQRGGMMGEGGHKPTARKGCQMHMNGDRRGWPKPALNSDEP